VKSLIIGSIVGLFASTAMAGLVNGDLEAPAGAPNESNDITGWTLTEVGVDAAGAALDTASFVGFANHTSGGARGLWFRSFMGGAPFIPGGSPSVDAILAQDVSGAVAGQSYSLSAWYFMERFYSGFDEFRDTNTILSLEFLDAGNAILGGSSVDIDTVYDQQAVGTWQQFTVDGVAPVGTVALRVKSSFLRGSFEASNPQSAFVDDFTLTPEPASLTLLALGAAALIRRR